MAVRSSRKMLCESNNSCFGSLDKSNARTWIYDSLMVNKTEQNAMSCENYRITRNRWHKTWEKAFSAFVFVVCPVYINYKVIKTQMKLICHANRLCTFIYIEESNYAHAQLSLELISVTQRAYRAVQWNHKSELQCGHMRQSQRMNVITGGKWTSSSKSRFDFHFLLLNMNLVLSLFRCWFCSNKREPHNMLSITTEWKPINL